MILSKNEVVNNNFSLDFSIYSKGIYFIQVETNEGVFIEKITK